MRSTSIAIVIATGLAAFQAVPVRAAEQGHVLRSNPFNHPNLADTAVSGQGNPAAVSSVDSLELRGTMLAGRNSLANIGGMILGIGQTINGYTIVAVEERKVVLDKAGARKDLLVDD